MSKRRNDQAAVARRQARAMGRRQVDVAGLGICAGPGRWMCEAGYGHVCGAEPAMRSEAIRSRTAAEEAFFAQGEEVVVGFQGVRA